MFSLARTELCILFQLFLGVVGTAHAQETVQLQRQDRRPVQVTAYAPASPTCRGIGVISPGAGGTEKGYRYLAETMSRLGYLAVVVGHQESGRRALREHIRNNGLREGLAELITEPDAYRGRFMDIAAAKRWASDRCPAEASVLIGHSMGAATAMMEAGARNKLGVRGNDSFNVYIALSPQGAGSIFPENAWSDIRKPVLLLTGTRDTELGGASWETRTEPFKNMPPGCKWLGVIDGSSHLNFAGNGMSRNTEALVSMTIGNFLNSLLRGDCRSPAQLQGMNLTTK
jgi:predicted dienelactone hydrolase